MYKAGSYDLTYVTSESSLTFHRVIALRKVFGKALMCQTCGSGDRL